MLFSSSLHLSNTIFKEGYHHMNELKTLSHLHKLVFMKHTYSVT